MLCVEYKIWKQCPQIEINQVKNTQVVMYHSMWKLYDTYDYISPAWAFPAKPNLWWSRFLCLAVNFQAVLKLCSRIFVFMERVAIHGWNGLIWVEIP